MNMQFSKPTVSEPSQTFEIVSHMHEAKYTLCQNSCSCYVVALQGLIGAFNRALQSKYCLLSNSGVQKGTITLNLHYNAHIIIPTKLIGTESGFTGS